MKIARNAFAATVTTVLFCVFSENSMAAERSTLSLWGGVAPSSTSTEGTNYRGLQLSAGLQFPQSMEDRQSIRLSLSRVFDASPIDRYNLIVHAGYYLTEGLEIALLGGVQYLETRTPKGTYLKPVIGAEAKHLVTTFGTSSLSIFAAYQVAQGSTGTLALDGGGSDLSASTFSIGLLVSFGILPEPASDVHIH